MTAVMEQQRRASGVGSKNLRADPRGSERRRRPNCTTAEGGSHRHSGEQASGCTGLKYMTFFYFYIDILFDRLFYLIFL